MPKFSLLIVGILIAFAILSADAVRINPASETPTLTSVLGQMTSFAKYTVDEILAMLQNLKKSAKTNEESIDESWRDEERSVKRGIGKLANSYNIQLDKCDRLAARVKRLNMTITTEEELIVGGDIRIKDIQDMIKNMGSRQCDSNSLYLEFLKNYKETEIALQQLRKILTRSCGDVKANNKTTTSGAGAVNKPGAPGAITSLLHIAETFESKLSDEEKVVLTQVRHMVAMQDPDDDFSQDVEEEANADPESKPKAKTKKVEVKKNSEPRKIPEAASESLPSNSDPCIRLLNLIDILHRKIKAQIKELQEWQLDVADAYISYRISLEREIKELALEIKQADQYLERVFVDFAVAGAEVEECGKLSGDFEKSVSTLQSQLKAAENKYNEQKKKIAEELSLIDDILRLYMNQVVKARKSFEDKAEDNIRKGKK